MTLAAFLALSVGVLAAGRGLLEIATEDPVRTGPVLEVCDANVVNNDQNCNGVNNDGITPVACQKTVVGVSLLLKL